MIKSAYHCSDFDLAKHLGFTHVLLGISGWPGSVDRIVEEIQKARALGLGCIIGPFTNDETVNFDYADGVDLIEHLMIEGLLDTNADLIYLPDEPNLKKMEPRDVKAFNDSIKTISSDLKTVAVYSYSKSFNRYKNLTDYVGIDFYKKLTAWRKLKFFFRMWRFTFGNSSKIIGVPPVRYSPEEMWRHYCAWTFVSPVGFFWYPWTPNQEKNPDGTPWLDTDVSGLPDIQRLFKRLNGI